MELQNKFVTSCKAVLVSCNNHSLNLAGLHAASVGTKSMTFLALCKMDTNCS